MARRRKARWLLPPDRRCSPSKRLADIPVYRATEAELLDLAVIRAGGTDAFTIGTAAIDASYARLRIVCRIDWLVG